MFWPAAGQCRCCAVSPLQRESPVSGNQACWLMLELGGKRSWKEQESNEGAGIQFTQGRCGWHAFYWLTFPVHRVVQWTLIGDDGFLSFCWKTLLFCSNQIFRNNIKTRSLCLCNCSFWSRISFDFWVAFVLSGFSHLCLGECQSKRRLISFRLIELVVEGLLYVSVLSPSGKEG